ncbi:calmodulin regulator protein PCP4 isoform X1 [Neopsephotus bourkii]|nr:calmodulin regulator protein PCP4 isoform X1 [Neopsephotus bourkii]
MGEPGRGGGEGTRRGRVAHWLARARLIAGRRFLTLGAGRRERFAGWAAASRVLLPPPPPLLRDMSERQGTGATNGKEKTSAENDGQKKVQEEFDIDMDAPETERAAVAIQSQFRKFQKKKAGSQS